MPQLAVTLNLDGLDAERVEESCFEFGALAVSGGIIVALIATHFALMTVSAMWLQLMVPATLLEGVPHDSELYRKEAFAPVALMELFDDFQQAIDLVNDSDFGLQAGVFTGNLAHAMQAWDRLDVGGVIVGDVPSFRVDNMPYGGVKHSGLGREGIRYAIEDMTEQRLLVIRDVPG